MKRLNFKKAVCAFLIAALTFSISGIAASAAEISLGSSIGEESDDTEKLSEEETPGEPGENNEEAPEGNELPESYSSRELGYVTSVKTQKFNSCWVYAALAVLESTLLRMGYVTEDMSASHMNMWATERNDSKGWIRDIYSEGYPVISLGYLTSWQGGVFKSDYSDDLLDENVKGDEVPADLARYGVTSVRYLNKSNPDEVKRCIMNYGGAYSSYAHSSTCLSPSKLSYFMPESYSESYVGHSIEIVGWNDNYPRTSFTGAIGERPKNDGAWLIKNSWGDNNSLGGYFWISYEDAYLLSKKFTPSFAIEGVEEINDSVKLIQNEIYGATYDFGYVKKEKLTYINRFSFDRDFNVIDKVVFQTKAQGASYSIYFVPDDENSAPDADESRWTKLYEGVADHQGYFCADVDDFVYPDETGSIAVTIDTAGTEETSSIGVGEWLTVSGKQVFLNESVHGQSYIKDGDSIQDLMDWYKENNDDEIGGTFVIKAVTKQRFFPTLLGDANLDGKVDIQDVTEIQRHLSEHITLEKTAAANADYNQDGVISIEDCTCIQVVLAEL